MSTATPYDPKNRTLSKTIYYSHQDGLNAGDTVTSSPFPTAYTTEAQSPRDFADGLIEGGSSYTAEVLQGA